MRYYIIYLGLLAAGAALYAAARRYPRIQPWGWPAGGGLAIAMIAFLARYSEPQRFLNDFYKAYFPAGRIVHENPDALYDPVPVDFVNVPIVAYAFTPFTWLSRDAAGAVATILGVLAVLASFALLARLAKLDRQGMLLLAVLVIISGPLYNSLREGNATHFVLLGLAGVIALTQGRRHVEAGVLLGLCVVMKPPLAMLILPFMLAGHWRAVAGFGGILAAMGVASLAIFGVDLHQRWYETVVEPFQGHPLGAYNVQSVDGFVTRLLEGERYLTDWLPIEDISPAFAPVRTAIAALLLGGVVLAWWRSWSVRGADVFVLDICILLVVSMVVGPITWTHYYAQALIPLAFIIGGVIRLPAGPVWWGWLAVAVVLISMPPILVHPQRAPLDDLFARLLISNFFFGGVLLLGLLLTLRVRVAMALGDGTESPDGRAAGRPTQSMREQLLSG